MQMPERIFQIILTLSGIQIIETKNINVAVETLIHFCVVLKCFIFGTKEKVAKYANITNIVSRSLSNNQPKNNTATKNNK
jgi:hypothetical protein